MLPGLDALLYPRDRAELLDCISANEPLVRLEPISRDTRPRTGGQWRSKLWVAPNFDAPDPDLESLFCDAPLLELIGPKK